MKKFVLSLSVALSLATFMVACNTNAGADKNAQAGAVKISDTSGLAAFQSAKQQEAFAAVQVASMAGAQKASESHVRTITKYVPVKSSSRSSSAAKSSRNSAPKSTTSGSDSSKDVLNQSSDNAAKTTKKKGISNAAKGAIIGGVAGAVGGAVINKQNRVVGAVIGGVVGAAGGYGIGRTMDKKSSPYLATHDFGGYSAQ
jgi:predicted small secreted protein